MVHDNDGDDIYVNLYGVIKYDVILVVTYALNIYININISKQLNLNEYTLLYRIYCI